MVQRSLFVIQFLQCCYCEALVSASHLRNYSDPTTILRSSPGNRTIIPYKSHGKGETSATDSKWITTDVGLAAMSRTRMMTDTTTHACLLWNVQRHLWPDCISDSLTTLETTVVIRYRYHYRWVVICWVDCHIH